MTTPSNMLNERDEEERKPPPTTLWRKTWTRTLTANWIKPLKRASRDLSVKITK